MTGGEALQEEWRRVVPDPPAVTSVLLMISYLGGTTKVAKLLQKNAGSVRRYKSFEEYGKRKGNRRMPDHERRFLRDIIRREVDRRAVERIRKSGLGEQTAVNCAFRVSATRDERTMYDTTGEGWRPDGDFRGDLNAFCDAILERTWGSAFDSLMVWMIWAYGLPDDTEIIEGDVNWVHLDMPK